MFTIHYKRYNSLDENVYLYLDTNLERRKLKVEIDLDNQIVKYLHLKQMNSNMLNGNGVH